MLPAVDHNGVVSTFPLDISHHFDHICHNFEVRAVAVGSPVGDLELAHLMSLVTLYTVISDKI